MLQKLYLNPYIISNCVTCYKKGLQHLLDQLVLNDGIRDISYKAKRLLCNMVNLILYNKEIP